MFVTWFSHKKSQACHVCGFVKYIVTQLTTPGSV